VYSRRSRGWRAAQRTTLLAITKSYDRRARALKNVADNRCQPMLVVALESERIALPYAYLVERKLKPKVLPYRVARDLPSLGVTMVPNVFIVRSRRLAEPFTCF
jgi:hypothetical protein